MRLPGLRYRDEWIPNFFPARLAGPNQLVRLSRVGSMQVLTEQENRQLDEISMDPALFQRLEQSGHIVTADNAQRVMADLKKWQTRTYWGPGLHIVVLTKRCNLNCTYCHMNPEKISEDPKQFDMQPDTADAVIRFALSTPSPRIDFEFQGGEAFLNFEGMKHFVLEAKRQNASVGKQLKFTVVSNLMVVTDAHLEFCREHSIHLSYSLNGPQDIHDSMRITRSGAGSYKTVMERLRYFQEKYPGMLSTSPLCVIGKDNAKHTRRMIDFYHEQGFKGIAILKLKHLGNAVRSSLPFDIHEFLHYYLDGLDYIYEKNQRLGENYAERTLRVLLLKVIDRADGGYVDWRNPVGDFNGAITYDHDGEILPSDEARSMRGFFGLGNARDVTYEGLLRGGKALLSTNLSIRDRDSQCRECAYNPYCGVLPVLDYARTGDPTPKPHVSEECIQTLAILDWFFKRLLEDPLPIFRMLPGMDDFLMTLVEEAPKAAEEVASALSARR